MSDNKLYRVLYLPYDGYVVYRHCFDESKCDISAAIQVHKTATFVTRMEAKHYANFRNKLVAERGTDAVDDLENV